MTMESDATITGSGADTQASSQGGGRAVGAAREERSVWRLGSDTTPKRAPATVNAGERVASAALGAALLLVARHQRPAARVAAALAGTALLVHGIQGRSPIRGALERRRARREQARDREWEHGAPAGAWSVERSITIQRPREELFAFWRNPEHLRSIMGGFAEISVQEDRVHWKVPVPLGRALEWDTQLAQEQEPESIHWQSMPGADVRNEGSVHFRRAPGEWGTVVTLRFHVDFAGRVGAAAARALDLVPRALVGNALRRFKSLIEAGEIPTTERNPAARDHGYGR